MCCSAVSVCKIHVDLLLLDSVAYQRSKFTFILYNADPTNPKLRPTLLATKDGWMDGWMDGWGDGWMDGWGCMYVMSSSTCSVDGCVERVCVVYYML